MRNRSIYSLASAASAFSVIVLVAFPAVIALYLRRTVRRHFLVLYALFVSLVIIAALLTIYALAWAWTDAQRTKSQKGDFKSAHGVAAAGFALWVIAALALILQSIMLIQPKGTIRPEGVIGDRAPAEELEERPSPIQSVKRSISSRLRSATPTSPPAFNPNRTAPTSSAFSEYSVSLNSSFRQSVSHAIRPMTSKTKLIFQSPFLSKEPQSPSFGRDMSLDTPRQDDEFDSWDTSAVADTEDRQEAQKTTRARLETIPGSRPVSPARALDGPFPDDEIMSPPHSPIASPTSETSSLRFPIPPGRQGSIDQAHIHPLFRSESPVPPPLPSPGTVITASPYAGQVVSPDLQM